MAGNVRVVNIDLKTVDGFGEEWAAFDQTNLPPAEHRRIFNNYFSISPFASLPPMAQGFDLSCGSGRWADLMAERVGILHCAAPPNKALSVARRKLDRHEGVAFHHAGVDDISWADNSQDFGYWLGILYHIPDTEAGLHERVAKLEPGAPFLICRYYSCSNKPLWFRAIRTASDRARKVVSQLPFGARNTCPTTLAAAVYWPLTRVALLGDRLGEKVDNLPFAPHRHYRIYYDEDLCARSFGHLARATLQPCPDPRR